MSSTRLSQYGVGVQTYEDPIDVTTTTANWGWTGQNATVDYEILASSRLGQYGVGLSAYPEITGDAISVVATTGNWGWSGYSVTIPEQNIYTTTADWGWSTQKPIICSQDPSGYAYSFNSNVWPSCVFNDHVFGVRSATTIDLPLQSWGWQAWPATVNFSDPINITATTGNWGWVAYPSAVSYLYDIQCTISTYGWAGYSATVELPYDISLQAADWGWRGNPAGVSYGTDVGATIGTWGWQGQQASIVAPSFDIFARKADWGWLSYPATVRQTALLPGDIEAIAEAVYQKFVDEGVINQIFEVWMRSGCAQSYPQTFHTKEDGHQIVCGNITIDQVTDNKGNVTQTRQ